VKTGHLQVKEPFESLFTQGMVIHETFKTKAGEWVLPSDAVTKDGAWVHGTSGEPLELGGVEKMSKSKKNVVDPDTIIASYGADTARWFMLSDTPPERDIQWTEAGAEGSWRFTQKIWRLINDISVTPVQPISMDERGLALRRISHKTVAAVTDDLNDLRFNRAIARIYELANAISQSLQSANRSNALDGALREAGSFLVLLMAPMMPHLAEESWKLLGHKSAVVESNWPKVEPALVAVDEVTIAVQINGKRRDEMTVAKGLDRGAIEATALALDTIRRLLEGKTVNKVIVVPDRVVNIVCEG
jgi:leucyl-tRNA synthetase